MPLDSRAGNPLYSQSWPSALVQDHCTLQAGRNDWNGARARRRWTRRRASLGLGELRKGQPKQSRATGEVRRATVGQPEPEGWWTEGKERSTMAAKRLPHAPRMLEKRWAREKQVAMVRARLVAVEGPWASPRSALVSPSLRNK